MMNKFRESIFLVLLTFTFFLDACQSDTQTAKREEVKLEDTFYVESMNIDMGVLNRGVPAKITTVFHNNTKKPIEGLYLSTSCDCMDVKVAQENVAPNDTTLFTFTYDSKVPGMFQKDVTMDFINNKNDTLIIKVRGHVKQ